MNTADPSAKEIWSALAKVFLTLLALGLALPVFGSSSGLIVLAVLLHTAWFINLIWTDKHG